MTTDAAEIIVLFLFIFPSTLQGISVITKINVQLWGSEFYFLSPFTNLSSKKIVLSLSLILLYWKLTTYLTIVRFWSLLQKASLPSTSPPACLQIILENLTGFLVVGFLGVFFLIFFLRFWKSIVTHLISLEIILFCSLPQLFLVSQIPLLNWVTLALSK